MIQIHFWAKKPTDIVIRDGKTYVSVTPVDNALWVANYEEIEALRGQDYDPARGTRTGRAGGYRRRSSSDPYGFTRRSDPFAPRDERDQRSRSVKEEQIKEEIQAELYAQTHLYTQMYFDESGKFPIVP